MYKFFALVALCCSLVVAGCGTNYNIDEVPDISPENLYNIAKNNMTTGNYNIARLYLEALDSRYPFGDLTNQVQLDLIYVYYKQRESDLAYAQINRFIRLSPTHQNIDYVYYMKGLTEMQKRSEVIQDFLGLDRSEKDPTEYYNAFNTFNSLITTYPNSLYAADARQRMIYIKEQLAKREMAIANYYFDREAYVSSIRHTQNVLYTFRSTSQLQPALELMAESFDRLNLPVPAQNVRRIMAASLNGNNLTALKSPSSLIDAQSGNIIPANQVAPQNSQQDKGWFDDLVDTVSSWTDSLFN